jgi:isoquinoline 1-oxidoreductase
MSREPIIEAERYELFAAPVHRFTPDRREFLQIVGGGIAIGVALAPALAQQESGRRGGGAAPQDLSAWLHIAEDGGVTLYTGKVEVGQNARTSLTQAVADELRLDLAAIRMVMADTALTPYDAGTFGSQTTPNMTPTIRRAAAAARELLLDLAAEKLQVSRDTLEVSGGKVSQRGGGKSAAFGELSKGQKLARTITGTAIMPPAAWKVAGTPVRKVNGRDIVTGSHRYTSDVKRPGMLYGKILRAPAWGATLAALDKTGAEKLPGVTVVQDGTVAGVAAPSAQQAAVALARLNPEWKPAPTQPSTAELFDYLKKNPGQGGGGGGRGGATNVGSIEAGMAAGDERLTQTYTVAYIAHVPLEPRAAVAEWQDDRLTVWTGTQRPFGVRSELAQAFRIPEGQVRVIVPDTGSGYGGKHSGEAAIEAARLAKAAGAPVKLVWTREEEFTWAYFRPAGVIEVASAVRRDGAITAWEFHNYNSGGSAIRTLYDIPNQKIEFHPARSPLRQGSYRGLAATANHFARETHMDELAIAVKMDPLEFRLRNLKDARFRAVLEAAAERFGWAKAKPGPGQGFGIAGGFEKGSYVATCAEVAVDRAAGKIRVIRAVTAFECGAIVNPDGLRNQVEGSVIMGLGGALFEAAQFEDGRLLNGRLSRYRVPRFSDVPKVETVLLDRKDLSPLGAGETPIVAIAPAAGNAVFAATGQRLRHMPLTLEAGSSGVG